MQQDPSKFYQLFDTNKKMYYYNNPTNKTTSWLPPAGKPVVLLEGGEMVLDPDANKNAIIKKFGKISENT